MNSGPTSERVYGALKRLILEGRFRPGERLDPARIAEGLSSSVTPVRDALHMLTGEALVETRTGDGFRLPALDEPGLKDLYAWNAQLLMLALRTTKPFQLASGSVAEDDAATLAARTGALFAAIAACSRNIEHVRAVARASDRLHAVRELEPSRLGNVQEELDALFAAFRLGRIPQLRTLIVAYHRRRRRAAADLVRELYRLG